MSPEKLKKGKFKEKREERTLEMIKEPKTIETKKKKKSGLDLKKKRKKDKLDKNEEELPVKVADTADTMNLEKTKKKKKKKSKLGLKNKDDGMMYLDGIGHEEADQKHLGVEKQKTRKSVLKKKRRRDEENDVDGHNRDHIQADEHVDGEVVHLEVIDYKNLERELKGTMKEEKIKLGLKKKRRKEKTNKVDVSNEYQIHTDDTEVEVIDYKNLERELKGTMKEKKIKLGLKKKRRKEKTNKVDVSNEYQIHTDDTEADGSKSDPAKRSAHSKTLSKSRNSEKHTEAIKGTNIKTKKLQKEMNYTQKDLDRAKERKSEETLGGVEEKVEEIQSVDEDCSRGMKKWLIQYKESRPGLKILQERIDDFITAYEEQQEQEKKEKEAQAADGGWTVVVHHKGRKKTTDAETGVTVGSVALAAVADKMGRKKSKEVPIDFYRFQRREAQRNEIMILRSKFEQDKKRIQQLRAARKFRPY